LIYLITDVFACAEGSILGSRKSLPASYNKLYHHAAKDREVLFFSCTSGLPLLLVPCPSLATIAVGMAVGIRAVRRNT